MAPYCRRCGCRAYHVLEGAINTAGERYRCLNGCGCNTLADDLPKVDGFERRNHAWHAVPKARLL